MPIRVLFWNIENFSINKIANPSTRRRQTGSGKLTSAESSQERASYILDHVIETQPDIFMVVELETPYVERGRLVTGNGVNASLALLEMLRSGTRNQRRWMLVPPLQTGKKEGVAVFYNSRKLVFTGPYGWSGGAGGRARSTGERADYPTAFRECLPGDRTVPQGALFSGGRSERRCAGCVDFTRIVLRQSGMKVKVITEPIDYGVARAPFMTTFCEIEPDTDMVLRNITLFGIHAPASGGHANAYLRDLAKNDQIIETNELTEVRVIGGDFNVNVVTKELLPATPYTDLQQRHYALGLRPLAVAPQDPRGYRTYFGTHMKGRKSAKYWSTASERVYYPGYGYMGADKANYIAIDNFFTRYGQNLNPPNENNMTVINGVVGSPYTLHQVPEPGTPMGTVEYPIAMPGMRFSDPPAVGPPYAGGIHRLFRGWNNFGRIRSTSDHLALVIDI
ncbi:MAG TPA: hypothetical protein VHI13_01680 [Candidatus Kapabacteria bacterium]|nr:hypothetical protein [Candidatus Kapabacteria bacterium]